MFGLVAFLTYIVLEPFFSKNKPACTCKCHHGGTGGGSDTAAKRGSKGGYEKYRRLYIDSAGTVVQGPVVLNHLYCYSIESLTFCKQLVAG
jgi:hypothetical protein